MIKSIKKIWWLIVILILLFLAYFLLNVNSKERVNNYQDLNNSLEESVLNNLENESVAEFIPEMMSDEEKATIGMGAQMNIQVISRDEEGKVEAYKIIRTPADIINLNQ